MALSKQIDNSRLIRGGPILAIGLLLSLSIGLQEAVAVDLDSVKTSVRVSLQNRAWQQLEFALCRVLLVEEQLNIKTGNEIINRWKDKYHPKSLGITVLPAVSKSSWSPMLMYSRGKVVEIVGCEFDQLPPVLITEPWESSEINLCENKSLPMDQKKLSSSDLPKEFTFNQSYYKRIRSWSLREISLNSVYNSTASTGRDFLLLCVVGLG